MSKIQWPEKAEVLTAVGACALAFCEWYVANRFFATPAWEGGALLLAGVWQAATGVFVACILLVVVLTGHAREKKTLRNFLWEPIEKKTTVTRCCLAAFARYMGALALICGGLAVL